MQPYIKDVATVRWIKGVSMLRIFNVARAVTMSSLMLKYWEILLMKFGAFIQSNPEIVMDYAITRDYD